MHTSWKGASVWLRRPAALAVAVLATAGTLLIGPPASAADIVTPRLGIISTGGSGTLFVKDGPLDGPWVSPPSSDHITQLSMDGARIGIATSTNECWGRETLEGAWVLLADQCTNIQVSGNRIGILSTGNGGTLYVKDGALSAPWVLPPSSDHIVQFALDGARIVATTNNQYCWARESLSGAWTQLADQCTNAQVSGTRIGILSNGNGGTVYVKDGALTAPWVLPTGADNTTQFQLTAITTPGGPDPLGPTIAAIAQAELANKSHNKETGVNCNFYSGALGSGATCAGGWRSVAWCADFARWVWGQAGAKTSGLSASAGSFYTYGKANGTWHPVGDGYQPTVGDAVLYNLSGTYASHVGIVSAVSGASVTVISGNYSDAVKQTSSQEPGTISGYATPVR